MRVKPARRSRHLPGAYLRDYAYRENVVALCEVETIML